MLSPLPTTNPATTERSSFYSGSVSCAVFQSKRKKQSGARTDHSQQQQEIKMGFDNTNTGVLFKNTDRQSEQSPNYRGSLDVNGESFWLNAWLKTSKKGERYMSLPRSRRKAAAKTSTTAFRSETSDEARSPAQSLERDHVTARGGFRATRGGLKCQTGVTTA